MAGDAAGDAYPAEQPERATQIEQGQQYWHDEPGWEPSQGEYRFVYANGQLEISPFHKHDELLQHAGAGEGHTGPVAAGFVVVTSNTATWEVDSNMNVKGLDRIFRDYTKKVGWDWGGITNIEGEPFSDEFAPKRGRRLQYVWDQDDEHLRISSAPTSIVALGSDRVTQGRESHLLSGTMHIEGRRAYVSHICEGATQALYDFCDDQGLILYAANDNVIKTIEDLELGNTGDNDGEFDKPQLDERQPGGIYSCPICNRLFPTWDLYQKHRKVEAMDDGGEPQEDGKFPELPDMDDANPAHFTEQQPAIMPTSRKEASRVDGFEEAEADMFFTAYWAGSPVGYAALHNGKLSKLHGVLPNIKEHLTAKVQRYAEKEPKDLLDAPIPFIYDIEEDGIHLGHPGARTSDIPGRFTPGGIVEGMYEPGGKVVIRTMTNMPYTVRHMIELWYYQHPELSVTQVKLQDDKGGTTKIADNANIGGYIASLVAADPAAHQAVKALQDAGGKVFAVGGAVRDAIRGEDPKDIDLMVTGLPAADVRASLDRLPGRNEVTGKDFGVFRYHNRDSEVEVALPRKERSTGGGHRDFDVTTDHKMRPEEDLFRRDYTANAMAVDLSNGKLIDPYGGKEDIQRSILRAHNPDALSEDPLRIVRGLVANARHGFVPDDSTREQMKANAKSLEQLPPERIQAELDKLMAAKNPAQAIRLAHETRVLPFIFPEVDQAFGYNQNNPHHELELGDHLTSVLERASEKSDDPDVRLAALLHDIGKPASAWQDPDTGSNHYYEKRMPDGTTLGANHEDVGAEMAQKLLSRLRFPNNRVNRITTLIKHHMWAPFTTERGARKFLHRVGENNADDLMTIRWADQGGKSAYPGTPPKANSADINLEAQQNLLNHVRNQGQPTTQASLAINGNDLIQAGVPQGPQIGRVLQALTDAVVENPQLNNRDQLLTLALEHATL
jgi:tRNA nucleotidyltransferase (CCA-adding enzyme)